MIIIVEGPDCAGKSTFVNTLKEQTGYAVARSERPTSDTEDLVGHFTELFKKNKNLILDRAFYSEMVYAPIKRKKSLISVYDMYELERLLSKRGAMVIYLDTPTAELQRRYNNRGDDYITGEELALVDIEYRSLFSIPHLIPVLRHNEH